MVDVIGVAAVEDDGVAARLRRADDAGNRRAVHKVGTAIGPGLPAATDWEVFQLTKEVGRLLDLGSRRLIFYLTESLVASASCLTAPSFSRLDFRRGLSSSLSAGAASALLDCAFFLIGCFLIFCFVGKRWPPPHRDRGSSKSPCWPQC